MMNILYRLNLSFIAIALAGMALVAGCASVPANRPAGASSQPLARMQIAAVAADRDVLAFALAGQFALEQGDAIAAAKAFAKAAAVSDDAQIAAQATRVALAAKQWELAQAGVLRWQQLHADDPGLWQARAVLALHDGNADAAFADLQRLAQQPHGQGWRAVGQTLLAAPDPAQAAALLRRLVRPVDLGTEAKTWVALSELAEHLGARDLSQSLAQDAVKRFGSADTYVRAAQLKLAAGDKAAARALFVEAIKRSGNDRHLLLAYASMLGELGDNAQAAHVLAQGTQDDYSYAARAAFAARANDKALYETLYREAQTGKRPLSGMRMNLLGQLAELLDRKSAALAWYEQVPGDDEHWPQAQLRSAFLLDEVGQTARALDRLHQLQARSGDDDKQLGDAFLLEAEILAKRQRSAEAIAVYARGLQALPDDTRLLYARALLNDELDRVDAAVNDFRRLLALQPDNAEALNALGYTLADRTKEQAEALTLIEKALILKPGEPAIIDSLGWVQYRLGHLEQAVKQLRTAYAKQPDAEIAAHLGEVLWVSGNKDEARKIWAQGKLKDAKNKVLLETMKRLES